VHYKLKKVCKTESLRRPKQRFGAKPSEIFVSRWLKEVADPCGSALQRSVLSDKRAREGNALREMKTGHES
jgi:hypothetical protein